MLRIVDEAFIFVECDMKATSHEYVKTYAKEMFIFEFDVFCEIFKNCNVLIIWRFLHI
jgi:hypothetical protein